MWARGKILEKQRLVTSVAMALKPAAAGDMKINSRSLASRAREIMLLFLGAPVTARSVAMHEMPAADETACVHPPPEARCAATVFLYDLPAPCGDWRPKGKSTDAVFGPRIHISLGNQTNATLAVRDLQGGQAMGKAWQYRLWHSRCRTTCADRADLFYVPMLTAKKKYAQHRAACKACTAAHLLDSLPHLRADTAARHFMLLSKEHYVWADCVGTWKWPEGLLAHVTRVSASPTTLPPSLRRDATYMRTEEGNSFFEAADAHPHSLTIPFMGTVERQQAKDEEAVQMALSRSRTTLMSFLGSELHGDVAVRREVVRQCRKVADPAVCTATNFTSSDMLQHKLQSTFCLEPAGDSPFRKSVADSIALGCINRLTDLMTGKPHFRDWSKGRVLIDREDFVAGKVDLRAKLEAIPTSTVQAMRDVIRRKGRQFQISSSEDDADAVAALAQSILTLRAPDLATPALASKSEWRT